MNNKLLLSIEYLSFARVSSLIMIVSDLKYVPGSLENDGIVELILPLNSFMQNCIHQQIRTSDLITFFQI